MNLKSSNIAFCNDHHPLSMQPSTINLIAAIRAYRVTSLRGRKVCVIRVIRDSNSCHNLSSISTTFSLLNITYPILSLLIPSFS
jgi:hypothetical protein